MIKKEHDNQSLLDMKTIIRTTFLLLALLLPATAVAHDFEVDGIYYNINGNEATVTYRGTSSWNHNSYSGAVVIPETVVYNGMTYFVTSIGDYAFYGCSGLTNISIPNSVTSIGGSAFSGCSGLTSIDIPNSVISIGNSAFSGCSGLTNVNIPNSVTIIGNFAFYGCRGLTSIDIPNSVTTIGYGVFSGCTGLTSVTIPNSVTTIEGNTFLNCSGLTSITIPNSDIFIGSNAFYGTAWYNNQPDGVVYAGLVAYTYKGIMPEGTNLVLNDGTLGIAESAFSSCTGLTSITIPNSVTTIERYAFSGCSGLTSIDIPNSVTSIGNSAFSSCTGLTSITIPNSVTSIGSEAFSGCTGLASVNLPNSMTSISIRMFFGCTGLISVNIPNSVITIGYSAFSGCSNLAYISIPNSVTVVSEGAFEGTAWYDNQPEGLIYAGLVAYKYKGTMPSGTSIILEEGTKGITGGAFRGCAGLTNIDIPNSVIFIGLGAFYETTWYNTYWNAQPNGVIYAGLVAIGYKGELSNGVIILKDGTRGIGEWAFGTFEQEKGNISTSLGYYYPNALLSVVIPNSVTYIGTGAFENCFNLTSIEMGNSVSAIDDEAFRSCSSVQDIYCYAPVPPLCLKTYDEYSNNFTDYSATLHVPAASLAAYFTAPVWSNFENIVGDAVAPTGISVNKDSVEVQLGEQLNLTATVTPANASNKNVIWYSTNSDVATVENGKVTTVGLGECDIIATCFGMQAVCHISVYNRISMEHEEAMLLPNHMLTLTPTAPVMPDGFMVTSSDPTVAAARVMNRKVQIVGIKEGTTMITVGSVDGTAVPATCFVTVYTERGDLNCDGFINMDDLTALINYLITDDDTNIKLDNADFNNSGGVNMDDLTTLINYLLMN